MNRMLCVTTLVIFAFATGCASFHDAKSNKKPSKKDTKWSWFKKKEYQEPKTIIATWTEDMLVQPGKPATRGFGGRLYFYNERSQAIPVEGELIVYGFDDSQAVSNLDPITKQLVNGNISADKKFAFTAEQFTEHFSQGDLGASYSIWIPWDAVGGPQKKIMLMPTFITKEGRMVRGEITKVTLAGKSTPTMVRDNTTNTVQLASASIPTIDPNALATLREQQASLLLPPSQQQQTAPAAANQTVGRPTETMKTTTIRLEQPVARGNQAQTQTTNGAAGSLANAYMEQLAQQRNGINPSEAPNSIDMQSLAAELEAMRVSTMQASMGSNNHPNAALNQTVIPSLGHGIPATNWMQSHANSPTQPSPMNSGSNR